MRNVVRSGLLAMAVATVALTGISFAAPPEPTQLETLDSLEPLGPVGPLAPLGSLKPLLPLRPIGVTATVITRPATPPRARDSAAAKATPTAFNAPPAGMLAIPSATVRLGPRGGWVEAFEIDRTEVTVAEYTRCVTRTECAAPPTDGACNYGREGRAEHPINCVSLSEAARYCATLGKRLPSEVEWEYAARGASPTIPLVEFQSSKDACVERTNPGTCPVAQHPKSTSPFGAEDMLGNVWEWTRDISKTFDGKEEAVVKGGGWSGPRVALWVHASRPAQARADDLGFRCAKDRTPVPPPFDGHR